MSVDTTNRIIRDFIEALDRLEEEMGREVEREERIVENGGSERIHNAELRDENGEFLQDVVDYQKKNLGGYFGDRFIARARYQTWHRNSPMDVYGVGDYEEPENLPIAPGDRGDKVWLEVKSPKKADESRYLRELIQHFRDIDDVSEYSSPNPELPH